MVVGIVDTTDDNNIPGNRSLWYYTGCHLENHQILKKQLFNYLFYILFIFYQ